MEIHQVPADHPDALRLIEEVQGYYVSIYGGPDETPVEPAEFAAPHGAFLVGSAGDEAVATGAWRSATVDALGSSAAAEVKRMYVVAGRQRQGLAREMLIALETSARAAGREVMVLETGAPQTAAIAFYESQGYVPIAGFGHYRHAPEVRCFGRRIGA